MVKAWGFAHPRGGQAFVWGTGQCEEPLCSGEAQEGFLHTPVGAWLGHGHRSASPVCQVWHFPVRGLRHAPLPQCSSALEEQAPSLLR